MNSKVSSLCCTGQWAGCSHGPVDSDIGDQMSLRVCIPPIAEVEVATYRLICLTDIKAM